MQNLPELVARFLPHAQHKYILLNSGFYSPDIDRLYTIVSHLPDIGGSVRQGKPRHYLHYFTGSVDYYICEYDGVDTLFGKVAFSGFNPTIVKYHKFSLSSLKSNAFIQLDFSWFDF